MRRIAVFRGHVMRSYKEVSLWKNVTKKEWEDWTWQVRNRVTTVEELKEIVNLTPEEEKGVAQSLKVLRMAKPVLRC